MKLWRLTRKGTGLYGDMQQFIVRAETEAKARELAQEWAQGRSYGDYHRISGEDGDRGGLALRCTWLKPERSYCEELLPDGGAEVIVQDQLCDGHSGRWPQYQRERP